MCPNPVLVLLGAVCVPLRTSAPVGQLRPIVVETEPRVFGSSIGDLGDAVNLVLAGYMPARLIVFDYRPVADDQREAFDATRTRLAEAGSAVLVEMPAELVERGKSLPANSGQLGIVESAALLAEMACQAIWRLPDGYLAASDPRRDGQAAGF